jgi:ribonuclease BN (tRNA processing enzyme)
MKITVLGGSGGLVPGRLLTSFAINDDVVLDAGSMAEALTIEEQARVRNILLTHAHLDHSGTLPFFVDNIFGLREEPFVVHAIPETIQAVREHLFNNNIWPDFSMIPDFRRAAMRFSELRDETPTALGDLTATAVRVHHTVPAVGYIVDDGSSTVVFSGDTAATDRLWRLTSDLPRLRAVFIETSFPNRMQHIADASGHLTPRTLRDEVAKIGRDVPLFVYHIKPRFHDEVVAEVLDLGLKAVHFVEERAGYDL